VSGWSKWCFILQQHAIKYLSNNVCGNCIFPYTLFLVWYMRFCFTSFLVRLCKFLNQLKRLMTSLVGHLQSISVHFHVRHELLTPLHKQFSIIEVAYYILYLRHKRWWYSQSYLSFPFFHGFFSLVRSGNAIFLCKWNPHVSRVAYRLLPAVKWKPAMRDVNWANCQHQKNTTKQKTN